MDTNVSMIFGVVLVIYVVPFWLWQLSTHSKAESMKQLYPGSGKDAALDAKFAKFSWIWISGLVALLGIYSAVS